MPVSELTRLERKALAIGEWGHLVVGAAGVLAAWLSESQALLVAGLYSLTGFISAILNSRVFAPMTRSAGCHKIVDGVSKISMLWTIRPMMLLGLIAFAMFNAISIIVNYAIGGTHSTVRHEPIAIYIVAVSAVCAGLFLFQYVAWLGTGRRSEIVYREMREGIFDGLMACSVGAGLFTMPLLNGGPLEWLSPIGDFVVVILLCCLLVGRYYTPFMSGLAQLAKYNLAPEFIATARRSARPEFTGTVGTLVDVSVVEIGRSFQARIYRDPGLEMSAADMEALAQRIDKALCSALDRVESAVIISQHGYVFICSIEPTVCSATPK